MLSFGSRDLGTTFFYDDITFRLMASPSPRCIRAIFLLTLFFTMKVAAALLITASSVAAFAPTTFGVRSASLKMAEYDLDFGKKNSYVPAETGDGGQGQFGAVSPNNWKVPGTSPIGQSSYAGAPDGGDEPWFAEAVSTVSLDLAKAEETLKAFTKEAAAFKIDAFAESSPDGFSSKEAAMDALVGAMGYSGFLEASPKQLAGAWAKLQDSKSDE